MRVIKVATKQKSEFVEITAEISAIIQAENITDGVCVVFCPHTTCGVIINENADPAVKQDMLNYLDRLVPESSDYLHSEGNSNAHIKAALLGSSENIIIKAAKLILGSWQGVYFCEFDGPRQRKVYLKFLKE